MAVVADRAMSVVAKPDTHAIIVHPVFEESMQHITREDAADLLKQMLNTDVLFKPSPFGHRDTVRILRLRAVDVWTTRVEELYKYLLYDIPENLIEKTSEAIHIFSDGIPENFVNTNFEYRESHKLNQWKQHERDRNKGLDDIAVMITDGVKRPRSWSAETVKFV